MQKREFAENVILVGSFIGWHAEKSIWGAVLEKVWAKVLGNYSKVSDGAMTTSIRALTGFPT